MRKYIFHSALSTGFCFLLSVKVLTAQTGIVKGKISNDTEALQAATVSLGNKTTLSDSKGEFSFSVKPGIHAITVTYSGYQKIEKKISVTTDSTQYFDFILHPSNQMEEVIVVGSRSQVQRSNLTTPVPIDLIKVPNLPARQMELTRIIANEIPSFNAMPHGVAGGKATYPASLRGLGPDQTLVLLNGKRLHNTAFFWTFGTTGFGSIGTDLNAIPPAAIETVEVLRDGASAQYGSDAIAGVLNLQLKKSTALTSIQLHVGQHYKGDGEALSFSVNWGFILSKKGFLNFTGYFRFNNYTQRNGVYDSTVYYNMLRNTTQREIDSIKNLDNKKIGEKGFDRKNFHPTGDNQVYNSGIAINGNYPVNSKTSLYWTAVMNYRLNYDRSSGGYRFPKDSLRWVNTQLFPDGFQANGITRIPDISVIAGLNGITNSEWHWDFGMTYGQNCSSTDVTNTNNASQYLQGKNAQTEFYTGKLSFSQYNTNINFNRDFSKYFRKVKTFSVAFGGDFRIDQYKIEQGERASWDNYAPSSGREGGSQAVPGFRPENEVNEDRLVAAVYAEIEMEKKDRFLWNLAGRYEYYNDFGDNLAGKLALRYKFSKLLVWRGSISSGYRAPALQQRFYSATSQTGKNGLIYTTGTFRNDGEIASAFGISPLQAEKSINIGTGITSFISKNITVTIDAYWIQIKNRIIYSNSIQGDSLPEVRWLLDSLGYYNIQAVRFFSNAINTHTKGVDIVLNSRWPINKSMLEASLAANFNRTTLYGATQYAKNLPDNERYRNSLVNREEKGRVEYAYPRSKIILKVIYSIGKWKFNTNFIRYGEVAQLNNNPQTNPDEFFTPKTVTALNVSYKVKWWLSITAGAENLFNVYPDRLNYKSNTQNGLLIYSTAVTQFGYNGGYYYINMSFNF